MSGIPRTFKRFVNWRDKQPIMPTDLQAKADDAQTAHKVLTDNKTALNRRHAILSACNEKHLMRPQGLT